jgi:hypothetical protein
MANTSRPVLLLKNPTYQIVERLLVLSESRAPAPGVHSRPVTDTILQPSNVALARPEVNVVPATPVDSLSPLNRH